MPEERGIPVHLQSEEELEEFITRKLTEMQSHSPISAEKLAFRVIHHTRLTPKVLQHLRKQYLPNFSSMTWKDDIFPAFSTCLDTTDYIDHRAIPRRRIGTGANAPNDAGFAKEVLDQSSGKLERNGSWQGMEGHRRGHALGLVDLGIVPEAAKIVAMEQHYCDSRIMHWFIFLSNQTEMAWIAGRPLAQGY